jgi:hypothetical protein
VCVYIRFNLVLTNLASVVYITSHEQLHNYLSRCQKSSKPSLLSLPLLSIYHHLKAEIMKVLLIGATGNLGSRLVAALLSHNHRVVAFVRSPKKLETLLPSSVYCQLEVIQGSVNTPAIKSAILDSKCDAVVNVAGLASLAPWAHNGDLPQIFRAVLTAVQEAGAERRQPLRAWFIAGTGVLNYPGTETMLSSL